VRKISVLLADGHEAYRKGLARAVKAHPRLQLAAQVADGRHALEYVLERQPELAVLELRMPGLDGLEVCDILSGLDRPPRTRVVLLSGEANATLESAAKLVGAALLSKELARQELCERFVKLAAPAAGDQPE
jgi:two-component system, NarL family, nitrate/nitrite response regulator NarL